MDDDFSEDNLFGADDDDDKEWTPVRKTPKRRMSSFTTNQRKVTPTKTEYDWRISKKPTRRKSCYVPDQKRVSPTKTEYDWCISKKRPTRRKSCYVSDQKRDSEDDEPITIDKVLGFLNGDDDLIKFSNSSPIEAKGHYNDDTESSSRFKVLRTRRIDSKVQHKNDLVSDAKEKPNLKSNKEVFDIDENSTDTRDDKYEMNVSVEVEDFEDTASETIELPEIPPSDEDEDLTDVFGTNKPIITSVTSLRPSGATLITSSRPSGATLVSSSRQCGTTSVASPREIGATLATSSPKSDRITRTKNEYDWCISKKPTRRKSCYVPDQKRDSPTKNEYDWCSSKKPTRRKSCYVPDQNRETIGDLLTPIRYEPVYEPQPKRTPRPKKIYQDDECASFVGRRRTKCKHCDGYFYREQLNKHMMEVNAKKNKIMDKLLQIPVVKIVDVAKDVNLDPKLKARIKDLKFKLENRSANYTLRHCVHCEKAFVTLKQFNNHIVDVIFGLNVLKRNDTNKLLDYKIKLQTNNANKVKTIS